MMTTPRRERGRRSKKSAAPKNKTPRKSSRSRPSFPQIQRREALRDILHRIPGNNAVTQRTRILVAMQELGHVTTFEAMRYLDVFDPRPRVFELRHKDGHTINTVFKKEQTESGFTHRIGLYFLMPPPQMPLEFELAP